MVLYRNLFQDILVINWHEQIGRVCIDSMVEFVVSLHMLQFPNCRKLSESMVGFHLSRWPICIPEGLAGTRSLELHLEGEIHDPLCPRSLSLLGWCDFIFLH